MPTFTSQRPAGIAESFASLMQGNRGLSQSDMLKADNMISEVESHRATASHNNALAEKVRLEIEAAREGQRMRSDPAMATEYGARNAGIALPDANAVERNFRGEQVELAGPPNVNVGESSMPTGAVPIPTNVNPQQVGIYNAARAALLGNQLATGKTNAAELAKAGGEIQSQGIAGAVQTAIANGDVQGASAMNQGAKPGNAIKLFDNVGNTGATFAPATGTVNAAPGSNALIDSTLANVKAQTGQHNAQANNANASAETHRARTGAIKGGLAEDGSAPDNSAMVQAIANGDMSGPNMNTMRSTAAIANANRLIEQVKKVNPNWTADTFKTTQATTTAFAKGKQGDAIKAINTSIDHLESWRELADAVKNGNVQLINKVANAYGVATGKSPATDAAAARDIIGAEIVKGISGAGGGVEDRQKAQAALDASVKSPAQIAGTEATIKKLLGGQLKGLEQQYFAGTSGRKDFRDKYLTEAGRRAFESSGGGGREAAPAGWSIKKVD